MDRSCILRYHACPTSLGIWAARKWRVKLVYLHRSFDEVWVTRGLQFAIFAAFVLSCIAFSASPIGALESGFFAIVPLIISLFLVGLVGSGSDVLLAIPGLVREFIGKK